LKERIQHLAREYYPEIVSARRYLHRHPELSFREENTAAYIFSELTKMGLSPTKIAGNGVYAIINEKKHGRTMALRADMDALPITEANTHDFVSDNKGVMHACGHDVHMASLLGTTRILLAMKKEIRGSVKILFQPAEEKIPGGAKAMIEEGILENPAVNAAAGQHVEPYLPAGKVGFRSGDYMASSDEIVITLSGKGGHAALPWNINDTILAASQLIVSLQPVASRHAPAGIPTVLSFGKIETPGGSLNVIPDKVTISGTFRTFDENWRYKAHEKIRDIAMHAVAPFGVMADVEILVGYPVVKNDIKLTEQYRQFAVEYLGKDNVADLDQRMTAEDFGYFTHRLPSVFYRLGTGKNGEEEYPLHSSRFDVDENALLTGMGFMAYSTINYLRS